MLFVMFLVIFLLVNTLYAGLNSNFSLGTGILSHNYNSESQLEELTKLESTYFLPIESRAYFNFNYFYFTPKWVITPIANESGDGAIKSYISFLSFPFSFNVNDQLYLSAGISMYWQIMQGQGGTVTRDDGTGTSTFARPDYTQTSQQLLLQIEGVYSFTKNYDIGAEVFMGQLFKDRQHFHFLFVVRRHFNLNFLEGYNAI